MNTEKTIGADGIGVLMPKNTAMLRRAVGYCTLDGAHRYELSVNAINQAPVVLSERTGRMFYLPWAELVDLARGAGIDPEDMPEKRKPDEKLLQLCKDLLDLVRPEATELHDSFTWLLSKAHAPDCRICYARKVLMDAGML